MKIYKSRKKQGTLLGDHFYPCSKKARAGIFGFYVAHTAF